VKAEEALQAANTDETESTDSRSDNNSSVVSSDVPDVRYCGSLCNHYNGLHSGSCPFVHRSCVPFRLNKIVKSKTCRIEKSVGVYVPLG